MKLKRLFKNIPLKGIKGSKEIDITGISSHSKLVAPGYLFIARKGFQDNGDNYISEAIRGGAKAILTDMYNPFYKGIVQLIHSDPGSIEGQVALEFFQNPSRHLSVIGITGTNGKTTTSYLVYHLLNKAQIATGLIGTIEYVLGHVKIAASRTTPDVISNHKMISEMVAKKCRACVMEVTSHGLIQNRVYGIDFDIAVFTNLTQDHLDYHQDLDSYCGAKAKLFSALDQTKNQKEKCAIINIDCPRHSQIIKDIKTPILTYAIDQKADLQAHDIELFSTGSTFKIFCQNQEVTCSISLIGRFNIYNCLAAVAVGLKHKIPLEEIVQILSTFKTVSGRLELVTNHKGIKVYVDYAHTDDALKNVLTALREIKENKIITVFGCGGDRDQLKRPKMGLVANELSDFTIITSDNPRSEDPLLICQEIAKAFNNTSNFFIETDRKKAIAYALKMAEPNDIILIAGKGHETYQLFAHQMLDFDDRKVVQELCSENSQAVLL